MDELDRLGRDAAARLVAEVDRRVDVDEALLGLSDIESDASVVELGLETRRTRVWVIAAAVAAIVAVVVTGVVVGRNPTKRVVPNDQTTETTPAPTSSIAADLSTSTAATTTPTTTVGAEVQPVAVRVDATTPVIDGEAIYSEAIANTHSWVTAVTPSGRLFIGPSDGTSAQISEIVDGQPIDTGITSHGELRSALDERLYSVDWASDEVVAWAEGDAGKWSVDATGTGIGECGFDVQPDAVRCGQAVIPVEPRVDAAELEWSGLQLTTTRGGQVNKWALSLDSDEASITECTDDQCLAAWRVGDGVAWTPYLDQTSRFASRLVTMLRPEGRPATAWLRCGGDCRFIGANDDYLYTIGYDVDATGTPNITVRRFRTDLVGTEPELPADFLVNWPAAPDDHPTLADVPMLLPDQPPAGAVQAVRWEYADQPSPAARFTQIYFGVQSQATLMIETVGNQSPYEQPGDDVEIAPWDRASFARTAPGYETLQLVDPSGYVTIWSHGLSRDQVSAVARSLWRPQSSSSNWHVDYLPAGLQSIVQAWSLGVASRSITWSKNDGAQAELLITHGLPGVFLTPLFDATTVEDVAVGAAGGGKLYKLPDGRAAVVWSPSPDVYVMVASSDHDDDVVRIALSLHVVDEATWKSSSTIGTGDGCSSLFC